MHKRHFTYFHPMIQPNFLTEKKNDAFLCLENILRTFSYLNYRTLSPFSNVLGVKCGIHLCCNTCCEHMQLISIELPLLGNYASNGQINCNWIPRIPVQYKPNHKMQFC